MVMNRLLVGVAACALPLSVVACGSSNSSDPEIIPAGPHHQYVVSEVSVPTTMSEARAFGLDIGGKKSDKQDGTIDNRLGEGLASLVGRFDAQGAVTTAINNGSVILLVDFQATDLTSDSAAGLAVKLGSNPNPLPCTTPTDCGKHLAGTGTFSVAADSPDALGGKIVGNVFNGGPGDITLQLALGGAPVTLNLVHARAKATEITESGMTAILAGALTVTDFNATIIPVLQIQIAALLEADCGPAAQRNPNADCSCKTASTVSLLSFLQPAKPCEVTTDDLIQSPLVAASLGPDVCSTSSCTAPDAISLGIQIKTVKATF